jgi:hypothetical protein
MVGRTFSLSGELDYVGGSRPGAVNVIESDLGVGWTMRRRRRRKSRAREGGILTNVLVLEEKKLLTTKENVSPFLVERSHGLLKMFLSTKVEEEEEGYNNNDDGAATTEEDKDDDEG